MTLWAATSNFNKVVGRRRDITRVFLLLQTFRHVDMMMVLWFTFRPMKLMIIPRKWMAADSFQNHPKELSELGMLTKHVILLSWHLCLWWLICDAVLVSQDWLIHKASVQVTYFGKQLCHPLCHSTLADTSIPAWEPEDLTIPKWWPKSCERNESSGGSLNLYLNLRYFLYTFEMMIMRVLMAN